MAPRSPSLRRAMAIMHRSRPPLRLGRLSKRSLRRSRLVRSRLHRSPVPDRTIPTDHRAAPHSAAARRHVVAVERTLFIVKPDATSRSLVGKILAHVEDKGFRIVEARYTRLTREQCQEFYAEHVGKGFFAELVDFMTSGPVMLCCLEREGAVSA